jgi:hypothetical protein
VKRRREQPEAALQRAVMLVGSSCLRAQMAASAATLRRQYSKALAFVLACLISSASKLVGFALSSSRRRTAG